MTLQETVYQMFKIKSDFKKNKSSYEQNIQQFNQEKQNYSNLLQQGKQKVDNLLHLLRNSDFANFPADNLIDLSVHFGELFAGDTEIKLGNNNRINIYESSIKTNQIRNFFAAILAIKNKVETMEEFDFSKIETDILLLKPKIAYAAGRKKEVTPFKDFVDELVEAVKKSTNHEKAVKNFFSLIESVVAYHKFYGGKDN